MTKRSFQTQRLKDVSYMLGSKIDSLEMFQGLLVKMTSQYMMSQYDY